MDCPRCRTDMRFQYEVEERKVRFILWDCGCGHKVLERIRPNHALAHAHAAR